MMSDTETLKWEEFESAARKMFTVWVDGAELEWPKEAWKHLTTAGLTRGATILDATAAKIRLVTLARIYQEFCGFAWDENPETPLSYLAEDLKIDPVALGILAAKVESKIDLEELAEDDHVLEAVLLAVVDSQRHEIFECLRAAYGNEIRLYTRMRHTRSLVAENDSEGDEFEVTNANSAALEYVRNGFRF